MELGFFVCLFFPVIIWSFPTVTHVRGNCYLKWPPSKDFQAVCSSKQIECWETCVPSMKERQKKKRVFFSYLSFSNCLDSMMWEHHICTEALISWVTASMFPSTFWAWWTHSYVLLGTPMRKQAEGVCLRVLSAILLLCRLVDIPVERTFTQGCKES